MSGDLFDTAPLDFVCPRCTSTTSARFYGPCDSCRNALRASHGGEARDVDSVRMAMSEPSAEGSASET